MNLSVEFGSDVRVLRVCAVVCALLPLMMGFTGCASLHLDQAYIHDDVAQKSAESAQSAWQATDPAKLLDGQKEFFAKLSADEMATVRSSIIARRNLQLISLMRGDAGTVPQLRVRLRKLTGSDTAEGGTLARFAALDEQISHARTNLDLNELSLDQARRTFQGDGFHDDVSDCNKIVAPPLLPLPDNPKEADLAQIKAACDAVQQSELVVKSAFESGYVSDPRGNAAGELGLTHTGLTALRQQMDSQNTQAQALNAALKQLQKRIDEASNPTELAFAQSALMYCAADPDSAAASVAAKPVNITAIQAKLPECIARLGNDIDPLVKLAKHSYLADQIQSVLTSILKSKTDSALTDSPAFAPQFCDSTRTALRTLSLLSDAQKGFTVKQQQPGVNALLVALAYEQHEIAMARQGVLELQQRIAILEEKRAALASEISHLARALQLYGPSRDDGVPDKKGRNDTKVANLLAPQVKGGGRGPGKGKNEDPDEGAGRILTEVASSWNTGRYRAELADYADVDLIRRTSLVEASEIVGSWKKVLQPAFDELVAYGKGGLDSQTLAALATAIVNAGGFAAVAARVGN